MLLLLMSSQVGFVYKASAARLTVKQLLPSRMAQHVAVAHELVREAGAAHVTLVHLSA